MSRLPPMAKARLASSRRTPLATRAARVGERLEAMEGPEAARRKAHGQKAGGRGRKKLAGNLPASFRDTRDVVGAAVAMGERLEAMERPKAEANRMANLKRGKQKPEAAICRIGDTRDVVGAAVGMSGKSYEKEATKP